MSRSGVLRTGKLEGIASQRAVDKLESLRQEFAWIEDGKTVLLRGPDGHRAWWTFGGSKANTMLALGLAGLVAETAAKDGLEIGLKPEVGVLELRARLAELAGQEIRVPVEDDVLEELKFGECLPREFAVRMLSGRAAEAEGMGRVAGEEVGG